MTNNRKVWRISARRAASLIILFALVGLAISVYLSLAKFQSSYHCDKSLLSACSGGSTLSCDQILASSWSTVGWSATDAYPITLFGTSYYAVMLALALPLIVRRSAGITKSLLLYLAWSGVAICLPLAYYAYFVVGGVCLFCASLYLVNFGLLIAVLLLDRTGQRHQFGEIWRTKEQRASTLLLVGLFFLAVSMVQMLIYRQGTLEVGIEPRCITAIGALPSTPLVLPPGPREERPRSVEDVALFVDLACGRCAAAFESWSKIVEIRRERLHLLVYPVAYDHECDLGLGLATDPAKNHNSCRAARAVECLEEQVPGAGFAYIRALFEHRSKFTHKRDGVAFSTEHLLTVAAEIELGELSNEALEGCIEDARDDNPAHRRVRARGEIAGMDLKVSDLPATFLVFYDAYGERLRLGLRLSGHKKYPDIDRFLVRARDQIRSVVMTEMPIGEEGQS